MIDISLDGWLIGSLQLQLLVFAKSSEFCEISFNTVGRRGDLRSTFVDLNLQAGTLFMNSISNSPYDRPLKGASVGSLTQEGIDLLRFRKSEKTIDDRAESCTPPD
jgi:hypothetical protein